jgi:hypothetical protein
MTCHGVNEPTGLPTGFSGDRPLLLFTVLHSACTGFVTTGSNGHLVNDCVRVGRFETVSIGASFQGGLTSLPEHGSQQSWPLLKR